jgi:hypothetical protein
MGESLALTSELPIDLISRHPLVTNPHIRMCAVITAVLRAWGSRGEQVLREAYRELGHQTGRYMIATGVVQPGADLESYGRASEQIMDACGLGGWTRIDAGPLQHRTVVPGCAAYTEVYRSLAAPPQLCGIPFEWDNGCLDVINADLRIAPERCVYTGDAECHYVIRARELDRHPGAAALATDRPTPLEQAQAWTNPQAGLYAILSRSIDHFGPGAVAVLGDAMASLGRLTGEYMIEHHLVEAGATVEAIARMAGALTHIAGFREISLTGATDRVTLSAAENPFLPVLRFFGNGADVSRVVQEWENGWVATVNPRARSTVERDRFAGSSTDERVFDLHR